MKKFFFILTLISAVSISGLSSVSYAGPFDSRHEQCGSCAEKECRPFGDYCRKGNRRGDYGARRPVQSAAEARKLLEEYYSGQDVVIGEPSERRMVFVCDIYLKHGRLLDKVVVHKRGGRIRSILDTP